MNEQLKPLLKTLDENFAKLPVLPKNVNEFIVSVAPWLALVFGVLAILAGVAAFGVLSAFSPVAAVAGVGGYALTAILSSIVLLVQGVIELLAFPALKVRKVKGWNLMFYSLILSVVSSIVTLSVFGIVSSLVGALIGYYFLYQVKSYYK
jgi:hypothetical protein